MRSLQWYKRGAAYLAFFYHISSITMENQEKSGLHKMKVTNFRFMHCVSSWDAIGSYITMFYLSVVNNKPI